MEDIAGDITDEIFAYDAPGREIRLLDRNEIECVVRLTILKLQKRGLLEGEE